MVDDTVFFSNADGNVYTLHASSDEERWRFATDDEIQSTTAVADGTVFVGSHDGYVYALGISD